MIEKIERSILDRISQAAADRKLLSSPERVLPSLPKLPT